MKLLGTGIAQGLIETARNFTGSFHNPERLTAQQYPEQTPTLPERSRSFPILIYDNNDPDNLRCVACQICEKECPPQCIYIEMERDENGKSLKRPLTFDLDISVCMSCRICVDACPFDAIKMDNHFQIATTDRFRPLLLTKKELSKPNEYYQQIHPREAAETQARLDAETAKKQTKPTT